MVAMDTVSLPVGARSSLPSSDGLRRVPLRYHCSSASAGPELTQFREKVAPAGVTNGEAVA